MAKQRTDWSQSIDLSENSINLDPYENFRNAIIVRQTTDYKKALKKLKKHARNESALRVKRECEQFFRGELFFSLTNLDGEMIIAKLTNDV